MFSCFILQRQTWVRNEPDKDQVALPAADPTVTLLSTQVTVHQAVLCLQNNLLHSHTWGCAGATNPAGSERCNSISILLYTFIRNISLHLFHTGATSWEGCWFFTLQRMYVCMNSLFQHCYLVLQAAVPCERGLLDALQSKELPSASLFHQENF